MLIPLPFLYKLLAMQSAADTGLTDLVSKLWCRIYPVDTLNLTLLMHGLGTPVQDSV